MAPKTLDYEIWKYQHNTTQQYQHSSINFEGNQIIRLLLRDKLKFDISIIERQETGVKLASLKIIRLSTLLIFTNII